MKIAAAFAILCFAGSIAAAQSASTDTAGALVLGHKWRFEVNDPALNQDTNAAGKAEAQRQQTLREAGAVEVGQRGEVLTGPTAPKPAASMRYFAGYVYEIRVKNVSAKTITGMTLVYTFRDPVTHEIRGSWEFVSTTEIRADKTKTLAFRSIAPPTGSVDAKDAANKHKTFDEQVTVKEIHY